VFSAYPAKGVIPNDTPADLESDPEGVRQTYTPGGFKITPFSRSREKPLPATLRAPATFRIPEK